MHIYYHCKCRLQVVSSDCCQNNHQDNPLRHEAIQHLVLWLTYTNERRLNNSQIKMDACNHNNAASNFDAVVVATVDFIC